MASWKLIDVPDSASEYVGEVLEDSGKIAKSNLEEASKQIDKVSSAATKVIVLQINEAAG